ncbi:MAG TPA: thioredoxin family protein [Bacteroidales bacterium]|jgi:peroxiredoxin|nr:thioredoxin family protein [Bacteroidales bacterium]
MALTPTKMIDLGFDAPDFQLPDVISGKILSLAELRSDKATVIVFICNHCPYVRHIIKELVQAGKDYIPKGVSFVMINSNDVEKYPDDSPENMKIFAAENDFPFPYLFDETQQIAKAYDAACTPDFNVIDQNGKVVYRGRFDESRPESNKPVTGKDLRQALDLLLNGETVPENQIPSMGCNIKWK